MSYSLKEALKELKTIKEDNTPITTIAAAKKAGYTEIRRGKWSRLEGDVDVKYFKVDLPYVSSNKYDVEIRHNYATNPNTGKTIPVPEYRAAWFDSGYRNGRYHDYSYKNLKRDQVDLTQFRHDRDRAAEEKEIAEYTEKLNNFTGDGCMNMKDAEEYLDEIAKHIDVDPKVREDLLRRAKEAIGGPNDWCTVVVLTDRYAYNNPGAHSKISRKGMSKENAYYDAYYSNEPVYQQLNASAAWYYKYMKTKDADEFLAKQIQRENDIQAGKIKVDLN